KVKAEEVNSVVSKNGQLRVSGNQLVNQAGEAIQLKGMSTHGLQWFGQFSNYDSMKWLRDNWGMTVFRAAMYTQDGGYINDPSQKNKVKQAVQNAIDLGIYVIIDWHVLGEQDPNVYKQQAKGFFSEMASLYKDYPNVIYEICNEPNGSATTWNDKIKPYAEEVIPVIRSIAPGSIIIVGTGTWSQDVHDAANNPLYYSNIMYTTHFYAGTHGQWLRDRIDYARSKGVAVFITEWGTSDASGDGGPFLAESKVWTDFMQDRKISWANWSLCDKSEVSAALMPGASPYGGWSDAQLTASGKFVKDQMYGSSQPPSDGIAERFGQHVAARREVLGRQTAAEALQPSRGAFVHVGRPCCRPQAVRLAVIGEPDGNKRGFIALVLKDQLQPPRGSIPFGLQQL
ncbi:MAG TPA: hypothetical protein DEA91_06360, partial [Paenibacillus sp.]|nr:hypothetical protein [Paenibacillus sp.]